MKLSFLLVQRQTLLEQARQANLAFAYDRLSDFAQRITRAGLTGKVRLQAASPEVQRYYPTFTALHGSQSVIEEHFNDEDIQDLADVFTYLSTDSHLDLVFHLDELEVRFLGPLRYELARAGVIIDRELPANKHQNSIDCSYPDEDS